MACEEVRAGESAGSQPAVSMEKIEGVASSMRLRSAGSRVERAE